MTELNERRTTERIAVEIPLELITIPVTMAKGSHISLTKNISCSGLYCKLTHYIPPFTYVEVSLFFPPHPDIKPPHQITFRGIVVRTEPAEEKKDENDREYHIAIFIPSGINLEEQKIEQIIKTNNKQLEYTD